MVRVGLVSVSPYPSKMRMPIPSKKGSNARWNGAVTIHPPTAITTTDSHRRRPSPTGQYHRLAPGGLEFVVAATETAPDQVWRVVIVFDDGSRIACGLAILAIGVRPETSLAREAGLALGPRGGIAVDNHMLTNDPDIYAVGAMAYEMLTGQPPFAGRTPQETLAAHVTEAPQPVSARRAAVPPVLAEAVMRALAKKPADRWQGADDLLAALEQLMTTPSGGSASARSSWCAAPTNSP